MSPRPNHAQLADEDLLERVVAGDAAAFEVVYDRHNQVVFSLAMRLVGDPQAAQDLTQEAFLSAWRSAAGYSQARGSVRSWLLAIVRNRGIDRLRNLDAARRRRAALEAEEVSRVSPDAAEIAVNRATAQHVQKKLGDLPAEQEQAISLAYFGGYTHSEIAELLDLPLGTVKTRLRRGLASLRRRLDYGETAS